MMQVLICDNTAEDSVGRKISIFSIKNEFETTIGCSFQEENDENGIVFSSVANGHCIIIRQTGERAQVEDKEEDIEKLKEMIDDFVDSYPNGFVVLHLGVVGMDRSNYYLYPSVQAVQRSKISECKVIFYTTFNISKETFENETSDEYFLIGTTDPSELVNIIIGRMENG